MANVPAAEYVYTEAEVIAALDGVSGGDAIVTIETKRDGKPVSGEWWIPGTDPAAAKASTLRAKKVRYTRVSGEVSIAVVRP